MQTHIQIGLAQINPVLGFFQHNVNLIVQAAQQAHHEGVHVLLLPELALIGYQAEDLFLRPQFIREQRLALNVLIEQLKEFTDLHVIVGHIKEEKGHLYNAASVLVNGQIKHTYYKQELPNYGVFDEKRYFSAGQEASVFEVQGHRFGLAICEDIWLPHVAAQAAQAGAQSLLILNASPYTMDKDDLRTDVLRKHVSAQGLNTFYCNLVGGQDDLVFDGNSFVLNAKGKLVLELNTFVSALGIVRLSEQGLEKIDALSLADNQVAAMSRSMQKESSECIESEVWRALVLATADYCRKNHFNSVALGLSGGIDSALVMAIAFDALGPDKIHAVMMPSQYTADISVNDAADMAKRLNVRYDELAIAAGYESVMQTLAPLFTDLTPDTTEENIQARIRGVLLMAISNKFGSLVLTTGNKSELAMGYCTLYGDMVGGFAMLKDIPKTLVYRLSRWRNSVSPLIPERIITRAPSAELRDNQTDQDSLPEYDVLDAILERMMELNQSSQEIIEAGFPKDDVEKVSRLLRISEYKRRQGALGPKITRRAFARDWRIPVTNAYRF
ncbi:MAG: NAD+ synthase [Pelistega sp.]|nr:NAD+ synthase [Pelistega sp.]